jgi:hypothetical protein
MSKKPPKRKPVRKQKTPKTKAKKKLPERKTAKKGAPKKQTSEKKKLTPKKQEARRAAPSAAGPYSRHLGAIRTDYTVGKVGTVRVDINCDAPTRLTQAQIDDVDQMIGALVQLRDASLAQFSAAMGDASSPHDQVRKFWEFHHEDVDPSVTEERFVPALELVRAGFYPEDECVAVLDFKVSGSESDQLLVTKFRRDGALDHVSWES